MYDEVVEPSSIYADLIVNNDGVKNLAIEVLTCVFKEQLEVAQSGNNQQIASSNEFRQDVLKEVFNGSKNSR